ncbi:aldo/keto reductase [Devosia sp. A16]|uniref:aldo/keto reductase n=1 Tax=Devosia sp. A16 TaxID=1736675 RepID=UPI001F421704|nr:aldo/keto reductase [Devosia sp. A16]
MTLRLWDGREVPRIGVGCWAIGGPFKMDGRQDGWGEIDDAQSLRALALARELGARLFDTADAYGTGHSEEILGRAFGNRADVVIATKFGFTHDRSKRELTGTDVTPEYMEKALAASLSRLGRERIDLYQLHVGDASAEAMERLAPALERRAGAGDIAAWGWSTDDAAAVSRVLHYPHFKAVQQGLDVFRDGPQMVTLCDRHRLPNLIRSPLAMGFLTGKFTAQSRVSTDDVRGAGHSWVRDFKDGRPSAESLRKLDAIRDLLTSGGRSVAQGALGWVLARSPQTIPIPGFKTEAQIRDNLGALDKGPLPMAAMAEIDALLGRELALEEI